MALAHPAITITILRTMTTTAAAAAVVQKTAYTTLVGEQFTYNVTHTPHKVVHGTNVGHAK